MGTFKKYYFGKSKKRYGEQFVFSTYKIISSAVYSAQVRNSTASLMDVGFDMSGVIDVSAITAHAAGSAAEFSKVYDQKGKAGYISVEQATVANPKPLCTDASSNGITYWRDISQTAGLYKVGDLPIAMNKDYIVNYVFRNETQVNNNRLNFMIKTDLAGHSGLLAVCIRPSSSNYIVGVKYLYANRALNTGDRNYTVSIGNTNTTFTLYTFSFIQGVFRFYRNGVEITATTTADSVGGINIKEFLSV